jgi:hypothetical protein
VITLKTEYMVKDLNDNHNVLREELEGIIKDYFPEFHPHGLLKIPIHNLFIRRYEIIEGTRTLGEVQATYGKAEGTEIEFMGTYTYELMTKFLDKTKDKLKWIELRKNLSI